MTSGGRVSCAFCTHVLGEHDRPLLAGTDLVVAFHDAYPSAPGHILIIPRRHVGRVTDLTPEEGNDLWSVARWLLTGITSAGVTVGINDGPAAGQTVAHVHLHLIPRNPGDVNDARGGIRWVLPSTADYWSARQQESGDGQSDTSLADGSTTIPETHIGAA